MRIQIKYQDEDGKIRFCYTESWGTTEEECFIEAMKNFRASYAGKLWAQMNQKADALVQEMLRALTAVDKLPEELQAGAVNLLCDKLADCRALACSWANDHGEP